MQVGKSETKGFTVSLLAAVYPGALAAGIVHTPATTTKSQIKLEISTNSLTAVTTEGRYCINSKLSFVPSRDSS